jgi:mRNA interferase RelE/StbE
MARHKIEISRTAERQLKKLPRIDQERVVKTILALANDPFPKGSRRLSGYHDVFRVRTGRYRVLYSVEKSKLIVIILKVGYRKDVYR